MSVSSISFLSSSGLSADGPSVTSGPADTHTAFAHAMAGASKPKAAARPARADARDQVAANQGKPAKAKDDSDKDDAEPAKDQDRTQPTAPVQSAGGTSAAAASKPDAKSAVKAGDAARVAPGDKDRAPSAVAEPNAADADLIDSALAAPVLAALAEAAAAGHGKPVAPDRATAPDPAPAATPQPTPQAEAAAPLPTTAAMMAARAVVSSAVQPKEARETVAPRKGRDAAAADQTASIDSLATTVPARAADTLQADVSPASIPDATRQLADEGAGRQLDLAKQGAWLDGLSRDIAATGDASGTLRFQVAPQHLGLVQVELARGAEGAAVTLTASSESARAMLADARPQLVAEAKAQGIHIAAAQIGVGADSRSSGSGAQPERQHDPRGHNGSSQMSGNGSNNGQSQTRSQPIAVNQTHDGRADPPAGEADTAAASEPADGMYA